MSILVVILTLGVVLFSLALVRMPQRARKPAARRTAAPSSVLPEAERVARASTQQRLAHDIAALRQTMRERVVEPPEAAFWAGTDFADTLPGSHDVPPSTLRQMAANDAWAAPQPRADLRVILNF